MGKLQRVLIMAGGTGGHVFPGLAVAQLLKEQGVDVRWLGTQSGIEARLVPAAGIPLDCLGIAGWRGKGWRTWLSAPFQLFKAVAQAVQVIQAYRPDVVLGMGGFVSGPGGIASWLLRRPLVIQEQNAIPGMTNRWLARVARRVLQAFPGTFAQGAITTGNPVRPDIVAVGAAQAGKDWPVTVGRPLRLLVLGGSLGAVAINRLLPQAIAALPEGQRPDVWHQSGEKHFSDTLAAWQAAGISARVEPFIQAMGEAYDWSDFVLCRAGALTVSELCAAGRGAILVPYPHAVDDHQAANAAFMVKAGAAQMIRQADLDVARLRDLLFEWVKTPAFCQRRGEAARRLGQGQAAADIIRFCEEAGL